MSDTTIYLAAGTLLGIFLSEIGRVRYYKTMYNLEKLRAEEYKNNADFSQKVSDHWKGDCEKITQSHKQKSDQIVG